MLQCSDLPLFFESPLNVCFRLNPYGVANIARRSISDSMTILIHPLPVTKRQLAREFGKILLMLNSSNRLASTVCRFLRSHFGFYKA